MLIMFNRAHSKGERQTHVILNMKELMDHVRLLIYIMFVHQLISVFMIFFKIKFLLCEENVWTL